MVMEKKKDKNDFLNKKITSSSPISIFRRYSVADVGSGSSIGRTHHENSPSTPTSCDSPTSNFKRRVAENKIVKKLKVLEFVNEKREEFQKDLYKDGRASQLIRTKDKFSFVLGVLNLCVISFICGKYPLYLQYFFSVEYLVLFATRIVLYKRKKLHYFLFDFCYFANLMLLFFIFGLPDRQWYFITCFCIANGPLLGAVIPYRNSMVFHSLDKATSVIVHIFPSLVTYSLRWNDDFLFSKQNQKEEPNWKNFYLYPIVAYSIWQLVYFFWVGKFKKETIKENNYTTSLSFLSTIKEGKKGSLISRYLNFAKPNHRLFFFIFSQFTYTFLTILPCWLYYKYQVIHSLYLIFVVTVCLWNGANFYIEYFSSNYVAQMKAREERWTKIIMSSIGNTTNFNSSCDSPIMEYAKQQSSNTPTLAHYKKDKPKDQNQQIPSSQKHQSGHETQFDSDTSYINHEDLAPDTDEDHQNYGYPSKPHQ
ncbi:hypothetical protein RB653_002509 [Dictyostelium firmibasis]|uniref:Glycerophosphocholine acyltransferase 1 n=1 Tax=Dictyostelium firmibasis TaxID=79012 RepID=A0AAN7YSR9_9MYCE